MEDYSNQPWLQLFHPPDHNAPTINAIFRLVERRGEPLLLLPTDATLASTGLELYPAQTTKARAAKAALKLILRAGGGIGTRRVTLQLNPDSNFFQFLGGSPARDKSAPFALLLGNAHTIGRRFILMAFSGDGTPAKVVKAGTDAAAIGLIRREQTFLQQAPTERIHAPRVLGCFGADGIEAIALEYCPGKPPGLNESSAIAPLLTSWINNSDTVQTMSLPAWSRLEQAAGGLPLFAKLSRVFANKPIHSAIYHGDFAPWNIRVTPATNAWRILDWERGELSGPPAWDWFHFVIQPLLLVKKLRLKAVAERIEDMLHSDAFSTYAEAANISELCQPLLLAYLLYCRDVLKPSEGRTETDALLELLSDCWAPLLD